MDHVLGVAPGVGSGAGRESAPLVPERHRPAQARRDHRGSSSHVQGLGGTAHHHRQHLSVAGQAAGRGRGDRPDMVQLAPARHSTVPAAGVAVAQGPHVHGHRDVGAFPSHGGTLGAVEVPVGQLAQGVGSSPGGRAQILPSPRPELGIHHGKEGSTVRVRQRAFKRPAYRRLFVQRACARSRSRSRPRRR